MVDISVTEYSAGLVVAGHGTPVGIEPAINRRTITFTVAQTITLDTNTRLVRLEPTAQAYMEWNGTAATAVDTPLGANRVEYFGAAPGVDGAARAFSIHDGIS